MAAPEDQHRCVKPALWRFGCEWRVCRDRGAGGPSVGGLVHHPNRPASERSQALPGLFRGIQAGVEMGVLLHGVGTSGIASWFGAVATWPPSLHGVLCPRSKGAQSPHSPWELEQTLGGSFVPAFLQMCCGPSKGDQSLWVQGLVAGRDSGQSCPSSCAQCTPIKGCAGGRSQAGGQ